MGKGSNGSNIEATTANIDGASVVDVVPADVEVGSSIAGNVAVKPSHWESIATAIAFLLLGISSIFAWSNVLHLMPYFSESFLDNWDAGNSLLGVFQVGNLTVQCLLLRVGTLYESLLHIGLVLGAGMYVIIGPCVVYGTFTTRIALLHLICLVLGAGSGLLQGSGFSIAAVLPSNQVGIYSAGQGFAAILSILLIGVCAEAVLDLKVASDVALTIYITTGVTLAVGLISMVLTIYVVRQPAARAALSAAQEETLEYKSRKNATDNTRQATEDNRHIPLKEIGCTVDTQGSASGEQQRPLINVIWDARVPLACVFVNFFITLNLFPRVGPLKWHTINAPRNHILWLFAVFQFGDTTGKCLTVISGKHLRCLEKIVKFPTKFLPWLTCLRLLLYVPFFLSKSLVDNIFFNAFWWQLVAMAIIALSHGWLSTVSLMYSFEAVESVQDKRRVGPLGVLCLIFGLLAGLYLALLYR